MHLSFAAFEQLWGAPIAPHTPEPGAVAAPAPWAAAGWAVRQVVTDSRADLREALFIPLVGERFDGHRFVAQTLLEQGAVAAVLQRGRMAPAEAVSLAQASGCPLWWVEDTTEAYQQLARLWRQRQGWPLVAVTGSAGKTTTRELIRAVLQPLGAVVASMGNENNDIGVPRTLLRADASSAALVVEMGMRGLGEINRLSVCAEPDVAVITNIGTAHIGRLGSREAIAQAKCEITAGLRPDGLVVIPAGDPLLENALAAVWSGAVQRVALADDPLADGTPRPDWLGHVLESEEQILNVQRWPGGTAPLPVALPLAGRHNARNLLLALAAACRLGALPQDRGAGSPLNIDVAMEGGRNRRLHLAGLTVLDETYNASPEAVLAALELLANQPGRRFAVLGTMLELGACSEALHHQVGARAAALGLDGLVVVAEGPEGAALRKGAAGLAQVAQVSQPEEALAPLAHWLKPGDALLLKASRGVALERLLPLLETLPFA